MDPVRSDPDAERQTSQDHRLGGGVGSADVRGRIGLGISQGLGGFEGVGERGAFLVHGGEDVVGGAVDDPEHPADLFSRQ